MAVYGAEQQRKRGERYENVADKKCKHCGKDNHSSIMCFAKPRKRIKNISSKTLFKKQATDREWYRLNPPSEKGIWICYLQIAPNCPKQLTRSTITLEHVKSKARHPELKFVVDNLKPACEFCNKLKGSLDVEEVLEKYKT